MVVIFQTDYSSYRCEFHAGQFYCQFYCHDIATIFSSLSEGSKYTLNWGEKVILYGE